MSTGNPSLYLLIGKERFLKTEFLETLRRRLFPDGEGSALDSQEFQAEQDPLGAILDHFQTSPFGAPERLTVVWGIDGWGKAERERLLDAVGKMPARSLLVLESEQTNAKKDSFLKKLSESAHLVACHTPFERDLPGWVEQRAKKSGIVLDRKAALFLIGCAGQELSSLAASVEQLALYVHPRKTAGAGDAERLFQKNAEDDVFRLAEHLLDNKLEEALRVLRALFEEGVRGPEIIAALGSQIERWKKGALRLAQGRTPEEIGLELKVPVFFQQPFFARLRRLTPQRLRALTRSLLACDEQFKSGQVSERLALEKFIWTS